MKLLLQLFFELLADLSSFEFFAQVIHVYTTFHFKLVRLENKITEMEGKRVLDICLKRYKHDEKRVQCNNRSIEQTDSEKFVLYELLLLRK